MEVVSNESVREPNFDDRWKLTGGREKRRNLGEFVSLLSESAEDRN
jgi:hypothetical protein